ncbi:MAG: ABC transporter permease [Acidimicrobiales bacterium]|nr:ABC transporter permease [Acidimicrobiales bacterium]
MFRYFVRRVLQLIPVFFITTALIFIVVRLIPGDPIQAQFGERRIPDTLRAAYEERYHFNEPLWKQYFLYMGDVLTFDLGDSIATQRPINDIFRESLPRTMRLAGLAVAFQAIIAIPLGIWMARKKDSFFDNASLVVTLVMLSIPPFVLGLLAQIYLGVKWNLFPVSGVNDGWYSYVLPALVIATSITAVTARLMRTTLLDVHREDYLRTARAKGLSERRVFTVHGLRNAMIPVVTVLAIDLGALLGGTIVTESVFNIPGIGFRITRAVVQRDNTIITGISIFLVMAYLVINLIVDMIYAWLDPRIRYD